MRAYRIPLLVAVCALSVIYIWLGLQSANPKLVRGISDLYLHGGAYFILTLFIGLALQAWAVRKALLIGFITAISHGFLLEVLQSFTSTRKADPIDFLSDLIGAGIGCLLLRMFLRGRE